MQATDLCYLLEWTDTQSLCLNATVITTSLHACLARTAIASKLTSPQTIKHKNIRLIRRRYSTQTSTAIIRPHSINNFNILFASSVAQKIKANIIFRKCSSLTNTHQSYVCRIHFSFLFFVSDKIYLLRFLLIIRLRFYLSCTICHRWCI
jgi:hypothetical protein